MGVWEGGCVGGVEKVVAQSSRTWFEGTAPSLSASFIILTKPPMITVRFIQFMVHLWIHISAVQGKVEPRLSLRRFGVCITQLAGEVLGITPLKPRLSNVRADGA